MSVQEVLLDNSVILLAFSQQNVPIGSPGLAAKRERPNGASAWNRGFAPPALSDGIGLKFSCCCDISNTKKGVLSSHFSSSLIMSANDCGFISISHFQVVVLHFLSLRFV